MSYAIEDAKRGAAWEKKYRGPTDFSGLSAVEVDQLQEGWGRWVEPYPLPPVVLKQFPKGVGLGTYGWKYDPELIEVALRKSVPMIDTAQGYGFGKVERELGKVIGRIKLGNTVLATKLPRNRMTSASAVRGAALRSREALQVETIDLYQIHWPVFLRMGEVMDGLAEMVEQKVVCKIGVCNFCWGQVVEARKMARQRGFDIVSNQIRLNQNDSTCLDYLVPRCEEAGVKVIAHSPLGQGKLVGDPQASLDWVLDKGADIAIPGTNSLENLRSNLSIRL